MWVRKFHARSPQSRGNRKKTAKKSKDNLMVLNERCYQPLFLFQKLYKICVSVEKASTKLSLKNAKKLSYQMLRKKNPEHK